MNISYPVTAVHPAISSCIGSWAEAETQVRAYALDIPKRQARAVGLRSVRTVDKNGNWADHTESLRATAPHLFEPDAWCFTMQLKGSGS